MSKRSRAMASLSWGAGIVTGLGLDNLKGWRKRKKAWKAALRSRKENRR